MRTALTVAVSVWNSRRDIRVYEVKVTQSDLDKEMQQGKWGAIVEAGASPYLALGPGLKIDKKDLPPGLGLAILNHAGWRHVVKVKPSDPTKAGHLLYETLAVTRREFAKLQEGRRRTSQEYIAGENIPDIPWAVQRAARAAGKDLRYWIRRMTEDHKEWEFRDQEIIKREERLRERERKISEYNSDSSLLAMLVEAKEAGIQVHQVKAVMDLERGSREVCHFIDAISKIGLWRRTRE